MSEDLRVLLVKLADRLHNMRTLHFIKSEDKRRRIARETMEIYAPLAQRVGMYEYMRKCSCWRSSNWSPKPATITGAWPRSAARAAARWATLPCRSSRRWPKPVRVEVAGREKHPYSIWKKMAERHVSFEQITDIMAFRVLVDDVGEC
jgi:GTP pyrophosphokinase